MTNRPSLPGKWLFGVLAIILLTFFGVLAWPAGVDVVVNNDGNIPIRELYLRFAGGVKYIPLVLPAHVVSVRVNPRGDSHLELDFTRGTDDHRHEVIDVYIEHDYGGTVSLRIDREGVIHTRDNIKIRWYLHGGGLRPEF